MRTLQATPKEMEARTARFDTHGPLANSALIRDGDFTLHVAECPPVQGPGLHAHHATTERFVCLDERFRIYWGDHGEHELVLERWDTVSMPPGVVRGFQIVSENLAHQLVLVTSGVSDMNDIAMTPDHRERLAAFGADVVPELEKTGLRFDAGVDG